MKGFFVNLKKESIYIHTSVHCIVWNWQNLYFSAWSFFGSRQELSKSKPQRDASFVSCLFVSYQTCSYNKTACNTNVWWAHPHPHICMHTHTCTHAHTHTHTHTEWHTQTHTHKHTHMEKLTINTISVYGGDFQVRRLWTPCIVLK